MQHYSNKIIQVQVMKNALFLLLFNSHVKLNKKLSTKLKNKSLSKVLNTFLLQKLTKLVFFLS